MCYATILGTTRINCGVTHFQTGYYHYLFLFRCHLFFLRVPSFLSSLLSALIFLSPFRGPNICFRFAICPEHMARASRQSSEHHWLRRFRSLDLFSISEGDLRGGNNWENLLSFHFPFGQQNLGSLAAN